MKLLIKEDSILVEEISSSGEVTVKAVSARDFALAVAGDIVLDTGWLGPNVRRMRQKGGHTVVLVEDPPTVRDVRFGQERFTIPTPRCLFKCVLRQRIVVRVALVACGAKSAFAWIPNDQMIVQRFPFGNVFDDTSICWGRNRELPKVGASEVAGLVRLFWEIPFNRDLDGRGQVAERWNGEETGGTLWLFRKLNGLAEFPEELLVRYETLRRWWEA